MAESQYDLANTIMGGRLRGYLINSRKRELSYRNIALALREYGIEVTDETVRRWCQEHLPEHV